MFLIMFIYIMPESANNNIIIFLVNVYGVCFQTRDFLLRNFYNDDGRISQIFRTTLTNI